METPPTRSSPAPSTLDRRPSTSPGTLVGTEARAGPLARAARSTSTRRAGAAVPGPSTTTARPAGRSGHRGRRRPAASPSSGTTDDGDRLHGDLHGRDDDGDGSRVTVIEEPGRRVARRLPRCRAAPGPAPDASAPRGRLPSPSRLRPCRPSLAVLTVPAGQPDDEHGRRPVFSAPRRPHPPGRARGPWPTAGQATATDLGSPSRHPSGRGQAPRPAGRGRPGGRRAGGPRAALRVTPAPMADAAAWMAAIGAAWDTRLARLVACRRHSTPAPATRRSRRYPEPRWSGSSSSCCS